MYKYLTTSHGTQYLVFKVTNMYQVDTCKLQDMFSIITIIILDEYLFYSLTSDMTDCIYILTSFNLVTEQSLPWCHMDYEIQ